MLILVSIHSIAKINPKNFIFLKLYFKININRNLPKQKISSTILKKYIINNSNNNITE